MKLLKTSNIKPQTKYDVWSIFILFHMMTVERVNNQLEIGTFPHLNNEPVIEKYLPTLKCITMTEDACYPFSINVILISLICHSYSLYLRIKHKTTDIKTVV